MNILGLDPATATGFCWTDGTKIEHGTWDLNNNRWPDMPGGRFHKLRENILQVHAQWGPVELLAFEEASFGGGHAGRPQKIQMQVIIFHNKIRGVIEEVACDIGCKVLLVNPASLKAWACDNGRATKSDMIRMLDRHYGLRVTDDNTADAIWVAKFAEQRLKRPELFASVPKPKKSRSPRVGAKGPRKLF